MRSNHMLTLATEGRTMLPNDVSMEDFTGYVHTVNSAIHPFDYEIRFTYPQTATTRSPDTAVYALVNTTSDPLTQMATTHTPDEIAFVKRVLDAIFETHNTKTREIMAIKDMEAVRLNKAPRNREGNVPNEDTQAQATQGSSSASITQAAAEQVLKKLVDEGWLEKSRNGYLTLKPRALMELRSWLVEMYNEPDEEDEDEGSQWQRIKFCEACREIVTSVRRHISVRNMPTMIDTLTQGQRCSNVDCLCRLHDFCTTGFFRNQQARKCPTCKVDWTSNSFVGERAERGSKERTRVSNASASNETSSRQSRASIQDNDDSSD
jgi:hypothetical protein